MDEHNVKGLSIALVDDQKIIWSQGFGFADEKNQIKATDKTVYRAGSVSKLFTAMAVMQLAEQNKLDINQPLVKYLPAFKMKSRFGSTDDISLKTILTHHSGLPSDLLNGIAGTNPPSFTTVVNGISDHYVAYPANKLFSYSNLGFTLAGHTVEKVSKRPYLKYMQESLLTPLNMVSSNFTGKPPTTKAYVDNDPIGEPALRDIPAGGLNTNVIDLSNLLKMVNAKGQFQDRQILQKQTLYTMLIQQNTDVALDLGKRIGLSWFFMDDYLSKQYTVVGHSGQTIAHSALLVAIPELKLGVVLLANSAGDDEVLDRIAKKIVRLSLPIKTGLAFKASESGYLPQIAVPFPNFSGFYSSEAGLVKIKGTPNAYSVKVMGETFLLKNDGHHLYSPKYRLFGFIPVDMGSISETKIFPQSIDGHQLIIGSDAGMQFILAEKILPAVGNVKWDRRLGKYQAINPSEVELFRIESFEFKLLNGFYIAEINVENEGIVQFPVKLLNDMEAVTQGLGRGLGETIYIHKTNGGELVEYSGLLFKRLGGAL